MAIEDADAAIDGLFKDVESVPIEHVFHKTEDIMNLVGLRAYRAGVDYANSFASLEKLAFIPDWNYTDDIKKLLGLLQTKPSSFNTNAIHDALMEGSGPPVEKMSQKYGYEQGKSVARTVIMNLYAKSALRKWDEDGIMHVKRIEMEDSVTCGLCRLLNGKEYVIKELLRIPNPLTEESHANCRGGFLPMLAVSTYAPKVRELPNLDINVKGNTAKRVPTELYQLLQSIMLKARLPFDIEFDNKIKEDYIKKGSTLIINPKTLADEDVREVIYSEEAEDKWSDPMVQKRVVDEYMPLVRYGFAKASRSFDSPKELFVNNWIAYRLGQAPIKDDLWSQSFFQDVKKSA